MMPRYHDCLVAGSRRLLVTHRVKRRYLSLLSSVIVHARKRKHHLKQKRLKVTTDESGGIAADTQIIQAYMAMEMTRGQQEVRASKVAEPQRYTEMLANPNLPPEAKSSVTVLLQNVARELTQLQKSASGGSGGGGFVTPTPATPSKPKLNSSSGSERSSESSTPHK